MMREHLQVAILVWSEARLAEGGKLLEYELHDIGSIHGGLPLMDNNVDFTLDKVHHINLKAMAVGTFQKNLVCLQHQVDKSPTDSINIPSLGGNAPAAHVDHNVVDMLEAFGGGNDTFLRNQRSKRLLVIFHSILMHPSASW